MILDEVKPNTLTVKEKIWCINWQIKTTEENQVENLNYKLICLYIYIATCLY